MACPEDRFPAGDPQQRCSATESDGHLSESVRISATERQSLALPDEIGKSVACIYTDCHPGGSVTVTNPSLDQIRETRLPSEAEA